MYEAVALLTLVHRGSMHEELQDDFVRNEQYVFLMCKLLDWQYRTNIFTNIISISILTYGKKKNKANVRTTRE